MKRYRIIIIGAITLLIAIFIGFTVRINMIFPNAKDVTYTSDNPPIIDGLKITMYIQSTNTARNQVSSLICVRKLPVRAVLWL